MKYLFSILTYILISLPLCLWGQTFNLDIRNQKVVDDAGVKYLEFSIYMTRTDPNTDLFLAECNFRLNFNKDSFSAPAYSTVLASRLSRYNYGISAPTAATNTLSIDLQAPSETDEGGLIDAINISTSGTLIGTFRIRGPIPGSLPGLSWRKHDDETLIDFKTIVQKFDDVYDQEAFAWPMVDNSANASYTPIPNALLSELQVNFTGDGSSDTNLYKIFVQSASETPIPAGSIGYYVYFNSAKASLLSSSDNSVSGGTFNWGGSPTSVVEQGSYGNGFDRRFKYIHTDGTQNDDFWPAYVDAAGAGINIASFRFNSLGTELDPANVVLFEPIEATSFKNHGESVNYTLYIDGATRPLGIANGTLPITLTRFTAAAHPSQGVALHWTTAMEKDNREFIIQRSSDAKTFTNVKTIAGAGNSSQTLHYSNTDEYPLPGVSYYRLAQVDFDGTTSYSKVVAVKQNKAFSDDPFIIGARPNPFHTRTEIQFQLPAETPVSITVTDALGKVIATDKMTGRAGKNAYTLKGDQLANGIYFFTLHTGSESRRFKLVKNR